MRTNGDRHGKGAEMAARMNSLDVAAWFISLAKGDGEPLAYASLQGSVVLAQSLYGHSMGKRLFNESILAGRGGPMTRAVRSAYFDGHDHAAITSPVTGLKMPSDDQIDCIAEVYATFSPLMRHGLPRKMRETGPWSRYYKQGDQAATIPFAELVKAWTEYKQAAWSCITVDCDLTPSNYRIPESSLGTFDDIIEGSIRRALGLEGPGGSGTPVQEGRRRG